jgi:hypothetical protein
MQCGQYVLTNLAEKWKTMFNLYHHGTGLKEVDDTMGLLAII